jgi:hypothetical protein
MLICLHTVDNAASFDAVHASTAAPYAASSFDSCHKS